MTEPLGSGVRELLGMRVRASTIRQVQAIAIAMLISIAAGSLLMLIAGRSPATVWWAMLTRTAGDPYALGQVLYKATALAFTGLAVSIALDAGLFNIGGEGQLTAGVLVCSVVGTAVPASTPALIALPLVIVAAAAGGGAIGFLIGITRVTRGAHEVITSIMLNLIVAGTTLWIGNATLFRGGTTRGAPIAPGAELPMLGFAGSSVNAALFIAIAGIAAVWWLRARTTWGQELRAVGRDVDAARCVGIDVGRVQVLAMTVAGALAGLAATSFVLGHKHSFEEGLGRGMGFLGIAVALLGLSHPVGIGLAALVLGFLSSGGLAVGDLVPKELTELLLGVVVLSVACAVAWVRRRNSGSA
ncbi:MAG TPA: ABC transporter permease [Kofleriaceae bacterium]